MSGPPSRLRYKADQRPYGKAGRAVKIRVNAFVIERLPTTPFHMYDVVITGASELTGRHKDAEAKKLNVRRAYEIIHRMQTVEHPSTFSPRAAYDGNKLLYSIVNLGGSRTFDVNMSDRRPVDPNNKKGVFTVKLTLARIFKPQLLNALLSGQTTDEDEHLAAINFLQVLLRQAPMQNTVRGAHNARSVFTEHHKRDVANFPLELWRGYFQSVRPAVNKMLVNVDMTAAAMYKAERVDFWAISFLHDQNARRLTQMTKDSPDFKRLKAALKNVRVLTKVPDNKRARPIREIICNVGNYDFFDDSINQTTTIKEYFVRRHGYRLQNPNSFGLGFGPGGKIVVPAEVCVIEPGQIYKKVLPPELAPDMLRFSAVLPHERIADIGNAVRGSFLSYHESDFVSQVGMRINPLPMEIVGRLLQPPVIQYRDGQAPTRNDTRGVWNVVNQKFVESGMPSTWAVVDFSGLDDNTIGRFTQDLIRACGTAGMNVNPSFQIFRGNAHNVPRSLEEASRQPRPDLLLIIVPDSAAPVIKGIKLWGDCTTGMRTQCIKRGKVPRANSQYHNNVALKINVKLGGINSLPGPASPISEALRKIPTMVVGADVGHPGPGIRDRPSITSLVASTDPYMSKYCAYTRIQPPRVEIIERLDHMIYEAMLKFVQINKAPPLRIIFFRDGVSEGEYDTVHKEEIPAIYRAWAKFLEVNKKQGVPLSLTFIVVGKRHHIRFFPAERDPSATEKSGNVHGGLVVDRDVSTPTALDFYLQSHSGLKGTSRSGHYVVLQDDSKFSMDQLQEVCYFLCFTYARATRAVSIPAPVYYADLVCTRARLYFKDDLAFSEAGSGGSREIDMAEWNRGFAKINEAMASTMFFM